MSGSLWLFVGLIPFFSLSNALTGYNYAFPVFLERPGDKNKEIGKKVTFLCEGYGDNLNLHWTFNGQRAENNEKIHIHTTHLHSTLAIENVTEEMEGDYCCCLCGYREWLSCGTLRIKRAPLVQIGPANTSAAVGQNVNLFCDITAHPTPTIAWVHNGRIICREKTNKRCTQTSRESSTQGVLEIFNATKSDIGIYQCNASNRLGAAYSENAYLDVTEPQSTQSTDKPTEAMSMPPARVYFIEEESTTSQDSIIQSTEAITSFPKTEAMTFYDLGMTNRTLVSVFSMTDEEYHDNLLNPNSAIFIVLFLGLSLACVIIIFLICVWKSKTRHQSTLITKLRNGRNNKMKQAFRGKEHVALQRLNYPFNKLQIEQELGEGVFGLVYKARAPGLLQPRQDAAVAVKMIRTSDRENPSKVEDFGREAELLSTFRHKNIIQLLGICFSEEGSSNLHDISCLLFEYMDGGDLCAYLRRHGPNKAFFGRSAERERDSGELTERDKLTMCLHIACGMQYLTERNFIHRDLATRNCLISERDCNIKIADFGLSRRTYESDYYKASDTESVPIRWMSPEAILYGKYSSQSDVWAYGVTLWEIYSHALQPYFSFTNEEVICCICQNKILSPPPGVPPWMYNLMQLCWQGNPEKRPNFSTVHSVLQAISLNDGELPVSETLLPPPHGFETVPETSATTSSDASNSSGRIVQYVTSDRKDFSSSFNIPPPKQFESEAPKYTMSLRDNRRGLIPSTTNGSLKPRRAISADSTGKDRRGFQRLSASIVNSRGYVVPFISDSTRSDSCLPDSPISTPYPDTDCGSDEESVV